MAKFRHFNYKCSCGNEFRKLMQVDIDKTLQCDKCGSDVESIDPLLVDGKCAQYIPFKEGWYEHLGPKPIYISSMKQLREVAKENGVYSHYAEDTC